MIYFISYGFADKVYIRYSSFFQRHPFRLLFSKMCELILSTVIAVSFNFLVIRNEPDFKTILCLYCSDCMFGNSFV